MPGVDGLEILRAVRQIDQRLPFVMISGVPSNDVRDAVAADPYSCLLVKPFSVQELRAQLTEFGFDDIAADD